jgi:hypothetical protein
MFDRMAWIGPASLDFGTVATLRAAAVLLGLTAGAAAAQELVTSGATDYAVDCNADGFVLAATDGSETLYLGRSCDAFGTGLGEGRWCWGNGGVSVELRGGQRGFARQELTCPTNAALGGTCGCWMD